MSWFRLDDQGAFHAKVVAAGNEPYGAWCRAGQWCSAQLTDGRIPWRIALTIGRRRLWNRLVEVGLCEPIDDEHLQIHDFLDYNPTGKSVRANRVRKAKNVAAHRARARRDLNGGAEIDGDVTGRVTGQVAGAVTAYRPDKKSGRNHGPIPIPIPIPPRPDPTEEQKQPNAGAAAAATSPDLDAIESELRRHEPFQLFDIPARARAIEQQFRTMQISKGTRIEWVLDSIRECAEKSAGIGLGIEALSNKLGGFVAKSKAPERSDLKQSAADRAWTPPEEAQ